MQTMRIKDGVVTKSINVSNLLMSGPVDGLNSATLRAANRNYRFPGDLNDQAIVQCARCQATTARGRACTRETCKIGGYCFQHLKSLFGLEVKPGAHGMGLFTTKDIPVNTAIMQYTGTPAGEDPEGNYVICDNQNRNCIDAASTQASVARYVNSCKGPRGVRSGPCNAHMKKHDHKYWLISKERIPRGQEIYFDYGPEYW